MSPATPWTELNVDASDWQRSTPLPSTGIVDVMFGAFVLTQPDFIDVIQDWAKLSVSATSGTELSIAATPWTELGA